MIKHDEIQEDTQVVVEGRRLLLQGQMRYVDDWKAIIFLCNPL